MLLLWAKYLILSCLKTENIHVHVDYTAIGTSVFFKKDFSSTDTISHIFALFTAMHKSVSSTPRTSLYDT